jgi:phage terminase Nu1 subunit (DNA packaging protein)
VAELLNQQQCAEWLDVSTRHVHNLVKLGLPTVNDAGKTAYPWPAGLHWYIRYQVELAKKGGTKPTAEASAEEDAAVRRREASARALKLEAEAEDAVLELHERRGQLVTVDYMAHQLDGVLRNLRAGVQNFEGRWADALVGLESTTAVRAVLRPASGSAGGSSSSASTSAAIDRVAMSSSIAADVLAEDDEPPADPDAGAADADG